MRYQVAMLLFCLLVLHYKYGIFSAIGPLGAFVNDRLADAWLCAAGLFLSGLVRSPLWWRLALAGSFIAGPGAAVLHFTGFEVAPDIVADLDARLADLWPRVAEVGVHVTATSLVAGALVFLALVYALIRFAGRLVRSAFEI